MTWALAEQDFRELQVEDPEIAVSILAELIAVKHGKVGTDGASAVSMRWTGALKG